MKIILATVVARRSRSGSRSRADAFETLIDEYSARCARYNPIESSLFETEHDLLRFLESQPGRSTPVTILLDSRGKQLSSNELATALGNYRDQGTQRLVLAIGPADGWTDRCRDSATLLLSFGRITLPHQLARVVLAEQVYRALTILAGHPYHSGH